MSTVVWLPRVPASQSTAAAPTPEMASATDTSSAAMGAGLLMVITPDTAQPKAVPSSRKTSTSQSTVSESPSNRSRLVGSTDLRMVQSYSLLNDSLAVFETVSS